MIQYNFTPAQQPMICEMPCVEIHSHLAQTLFTSYIMKSSLEKSENQQCLLCFTRPPRAGKPIMTDTLKTVYFSRRDASMLLRLDSDLIN